MAWSIALILCSVVLGVSGELLLKNGVNQVDEFDLGGVRAALETGAHVITTPSILIGFICYGVAAVLWIVVLSRLDLSYAYPMLALTYVLVPLAAKVFLNESVPSGRWVGIVIIIIGVAIVARYSESPQ